MKYLAKCNFFAQGKLFKAGTVIDIDPKDEGLYKGNIKSVATEKAGTEQKKVKKNGAN